MDWDVSASDNKIVVLRRFGARSLSGLVGESLWIHTVDASSSTASIERLPHKLVLADT